MANQGRLDPHTDVHQVLGYNYRLNEVAAAIGVVQMERFDELLTKRRQVACWYNRLLSDVPEIHLPPCPPPAESSWFVYVIRLGDGFDRKDRDRLIRMLGQEGIQCQTYFRPIHRQPSLRNLPAARQGYPVVEKVSDRTLSLPFYTDLSQPQVAWICKQVKAALARVTVRALPAHPDRPARAEPTPDAPPNPSRRRGP
jgi:perosamine synthetase